MAAPKGSKNAEKWTVEEVRKMAKQAYEVISPDCFFVTAIAEKCGVYRELFPYLLKKYANDEEVFTLLKRIYNKAEATIWELAAQGKLDKTIAIFALKSLHGLIETSRTESRQEVSGPEGKPVQVSSTHTVIFEDYSQR